MELAAFQAKAVLARAELHEILDGPGHSLTRL